MTRFTFSLSKAGLAADAGAVISDSFDDALAALAREPQIAVGDTIEIGVPGFPPARYECISFDALRRGFQPVARAAA